jgi:hypothetical protein
MMATWQDASSVSTAETLRRGEKKKKEHSDKHISYFRI